MGFSLQNVTWLKKKKKKYTFFRFAGAYSLESTAHPTEADTCYLKVHSSRVLDSVENWVNTSNHSLVHLPGCRR